jgi:hypothetical protein
LPDHLKTEAERGPDVLAASQTDPSLPKGRSRFAIPSIGDLIFSALLLGLATGPLSVSLLGDGGTGWHIRTGEWIWANHAIPRVDLFSSTMQGKPWYAWEWLYDAVVGALHGWGGLNGVVLFTAFVIALTFSLIFGRMRARGTQLPIAIVLLLVTFCASTVHLLARPHVVSWLFTVIWFLLLEKFATSAESRFLIWLPLIMVLWVNTHGGFLVGLILLALYWISEILAGIRADVITERSISFARARKLSVCGLLTVLATLANPYGYHLHAHIVQYLQDPFLMHHIQEFLAPDFHGVAQKCFAGLVLFGVVVAAVSRRRLPSRHALILLFAAASGLYAIRNIPVSSMLIVMISAPLLTIALENASAKRESEKRTRGMAARLDAFSMRVTRVDSTLRGHLWPVLISLLAICICWKGGTLAGHRWMNAHFDEQQFPVLAADFLSAHSDERPIFTRDRWAGYFIYRLYPEVRVAADDRHDLYGSEFLKNYLKIMRAESGWEPALESLHPGWVLVPVDSPLASPLSNNANWTMVHQDQTAELFRHNHP